MIADLVIREVEIALQRVFTINGEPYAHIVPESEAYPTSGQRFIRVTGRDTDVEIKDNSIHMTVNFCVDCSYRTRADSKQTKRAPYLDLLNMQENTYFTLAFNSELMTRIQENLPTGTKKYERFTTDRLHTEVQAVNPDFFGSSDVNEPVSPAPLATFPNEHLQMEAGYLVSTCFKSPTFQVDVSCLQLPFTPRLG